MTSLPATSPTAADLVATLTDLGVRLSRRGVRLAVDAPPGAMTPELIEQLHRQRSQVVDLLRLAEPCDACGSWDHRDVEIHNGRSLRRDCSECGRTLGFPTWSPEPRTVVNVAGLLPAKIKRTKPED